LVAFCGLWASDRINIFKYFFIACKEFLMVNITQKNNRLMKMSFWGGLFLVISVQNVNACEQYPDMMVYNGIEYTIDDDYPMESYFRRWGIPFGRKMPWSIALNRANKHGLRNTALRRGYKAKYEIINNKLILTSIETLRLFSGDFRRVFYNRRKINTYTGKIHLPNGEFTGVRMGWNGIFENYIVLDINKGNLINARPINCYEYLESMIQLYPNDASYLTGLLSELREREK
jgi:hypothetical protein